MNGRLFFLYLTDQATDASFGQHALQTPKPMLYWKPHLGWLTYDTASDIKELDPISWDIAKGEWLDQEDGETLVSFDNGSTYFDMSKVEEYVSDREPDEKSAWFARIYACLLGTYHQFNECTHWQKWVLLLKWTVLVL